MHLVFNLCLLGCIFISVLSSIATTSTGMYNFNNFNVLDSLIFRVRNIIYIFCKFSTRTYIIISVFFECLLLQLEIPACLMINTEILANRVGDVGFDREASITLLCSRAFVCVNLCRCGG